jgi:AraC-like DNA-binding protein
VIEYREFPPDRDLHPFVACTWERGAPDDGDSTERRILPDGCIDLVWRDGRLLIAGPDTSGRTSSVPPGDTVVGVRMRPGIGGAVLGLPANELRDAWIEAADIWARAGWELSEIVGEMPQSDVRRSLLQTALSTRIANSVRADPLVLAAVRRLGFPASRVAELADALGISERQLRRRFHDAVGYGPKTLDRVLRFQRLVARAPEVASGDGNLARLADLGYADQAHLNRDCVLLSGLTPTRLTSLWIS